MSEKIDIQDSRALQNVVENKLRDVLDQIPGLNDDWNETSLDSLEVILVCQQVEAELGLEIAMEDFAYEMTTANLIKFVQSQS